MRYSYIYLGIKVNTSILYIYIYIHNINSKYTSRSHEYITCCNRGRERIVIFC